MAVETKRFVSPKGISGDNAEVEVSVVMPCLNEAETLATCIEKAQASLRELNVHGEIVKGLLV